MSEILLSAEDCLEMYRRLSPMSLDLDISDPPSGIAFMQLAFDTDRGGRDHWIAWLAERKAAQLDALKPGAYSLTWALPRTAHWTGMALDNAGHRIVDTIHHVFGQGWNKNSALLRPGHEVWYLAQRPIEKGLTIEQNVARWGTGQLNIDACRVPRNWAERGEAWMRSGHSAKPDAKKIGGAPPGNGLTLHPGGSVPTTQVFSHCPECEEMGVRVIREAAPRPRNGQDTGQVFALQRKRDDARGHGSPNDTAVVPSFACLVGCDGCGGGFLAPSSGDPPACLGCGSEATWWACPVAELDQQAGERPSGAMAAGTPRPIGGNTYGEAAGRATEVDIRASTGGASRFFKTFCYQAKAASTERHAGCGHLFWRADKDAPIGWRRVTKAEWDKLPGDDRAQGNPHATIKSLGLLSWLMTLIAPPVERVPHRRGADGFLGSGGTAIVADQFGIDWYGCDVAQEAITIAECRLAYRRGGLHVPMPVREGKRKTPTAKPAASVAHDIPGGLFAGNISGDTR